MILAELEFREFTRLIIWGSTVITTLLLSLTVCFHSLSPALPQAELCMDYSRLERCYRLNHRLEPTASVAQPKKKKPRRLCLIPRNLLHHFRGFSVPTSPPNTTSTSSPGQRAWRKWGKIHRFVRNVSATCLAHPVRGTVCSMLIVSGLVSLTGRDSAVHEPESKVRREGRGRRREGRQILGRDRNMWSGYDCALKLEALKGAALLVNNIPCA